MDGNSVLDTTTENTGGEGGAPDNTNVVPPEGSSAGQESIYGDLQVQWPEGMDQELTNDHSLKPFVDSEGKVNYSNLMKSYVNTKKMVGGNKLQMPGDNATAEELDQFWEKLGYKSKDEEYVISEVENDVLDQDFLKGFREFARENRMPLEQANKLTEFIRERAKQGIDLEANNIKTRIDEGVNGLKEEWKGAFEHKVSLAQRVINEVVGDDTITEALKDPQIGSNPTVIKTLVKIGEKLFQEDKFDMNTKSQFNMTPAEAQEAINEIYADKNGPYFNKQDARHADTVKRMNKLFEIKNAV